MNNLNFTYPNGFMFHQGILAFLQDSIMLSAQAAASYAGGLAILKGCEINGTNVAAGLVIIDGEVLPFEAGQLDEKVIIQETVIDLPFDDDTFQPAQTMRVAKFGDDGVTDYQWSQFKRNTSEGVLSRLERLERVAAPFTNANKGGMVLWNRPANTIPAGWQEVVNWRGRLPMGYDPEQTEFNEVGKASGVKDRTLSLVNIPPHDHVVRAVRPHDGDSIATGGFDGGNNQNKWYNYTTNKSGGSGGSAVPFSVLNPYRVVVFIEYVGG